MSLAHQTLSIHNQLYECSTHGVGTHFVGDDFGQVAMQERLPNGKALHCVLCHPNHCDNPVRGLSGLHLFATTDQQIGERKIGEFFRRQFRRDHQ